MIKAYFEEFIKKIETERDREVAPIRDKIIREKILPHNTEIDTARAKALAEIDADYKAKIADLNKECEARKQELIKIGEDDKKSYQEETLSIELALYTTKYDRVIAKLRTQLDEIEE